MVFIKLSPSDILRCFYGNCQGKSVVKNDFVSSGTILIYPCYDRDAKIWFSFRVIINSKQLLSENAIVSHPPYIPNICTPNHKPHLSCSFSGVGSPRCIKCIDVDSGRRKASSSHPMQVHHTLWTSVQVNKTCSLVSYCKAQKGHKFDCKAAPLKDKFCLEGNRWDIVPHIRIWTFGTLNIHLPYGGKHLYRTILASFFHFTNSQVSRMHGVQFTRFMPPYPSIRLTLHKQNIV